ncbi:MAG: hypothetical protein COB53_12820 [Elusimicrobia bacterium]|nr:MAG: hypothetical protein COB53_12820 [Elusimicrobiota bacterium]
MKRLILVCASILITAGVSANDIHGGPVLDSIFNQADLVGKSLTDTLDVLRARDDNLRAQRRELTREVTQRRIDLETSLSLLATGNNGRLRAREVKRVLADAYLLVIQDEAEIQDSSRRNDERDEILLTLVDQIKGAAATDTALRSVQNSLSITTLPQGRDGYFPILDVAGLLDNSTDLRAEISPSVKDLAQKISALIAGPSRISQTSQLDHVNLAEFGVTTGTGEAATGVRISRDVLNELDRRTNQVTLGLIINLRSELARYFDLEDELHEAKSSQAALFAERELILITINEKVKRGSERSLLTEARKQMREGRPNDRKTLENQSFGQLTRLLNEIILHQGDVRIIEEDHTAKLNQIFTLIETISATRRGTS